MFEIIKEYNPETLLVKHLGKYYVFKELTDLEPEMLKALLKVKSHNICEIYGTQIMGEKMYLVMEHIEGATLEELVEKHGTLDYKETVRIAAAVCSGLEAFHKAGIVHRDISPGNIMIDNKGRVKIIDFGICRKFSGNKTADTQLLGTPGFASPEQYGFGQSGFRSDVYSVGVLINYMQTGAVPSKKLAEGKLRKIIVRCTQVEENLRYPDVRSLRNAILYGNLFGKSIVPGFRENVLWHKIVAIIYYTFSALINIIMIFATKGNLKEILTWFVSFSIVLIIPELVAFNFLNWSNRLKFTCAFSKLQRVLFLAAAGIITFLILVIIIPPNWTYSGTTQH